MAASDKSKMVGGLRYENLSSGLYGYMTGMNQTPSYRAKHGHNSSFLTPPAKRRPRRQPVSPDPMGSKAARGSYNASVAGPQTVQTRKASGTLVGRPINSALNPVLAARASGKAAVQAARQTGSRMDVVAAKEARKQSVGEAKAYRRTFSAAENRASKKAFKAIGGRRLLRGRVKVF
jgi:hypothetical protein